MLDEDARRRLQTRHHLDKLEAESEIHQRENPGSYKIKFSERARQCLERFFAITLDEVQREPSQKRKDILARLRRFADSKPPSLFCDPLVTLEWKWQGETFYVECCPVILQLLDGETVELCTVATKEGVPDRVTDEYVNFEAPHLTLELLAEGVRRWLAVHCPPLSNLPIEWLPQDRQGEIAERHLAKEYWPDEDA